MSKRNRKPEPEAAEPAPFAGNVNEDGSPAGSAFDDGMDAVGNDAPSVASSDISPVGDGGEGPAGEDPEVGTIEQPPHKLDATPKPQTRREVITARIAHIERDGGPIGRTQRINEQAKAMRKLRNDMIAEADREVNDLLSQVRAMEALQQKELEEARVLKIELEKLAD